MMRSDFSGGEVIQNDSPICGRDEGSPKEPFEAVENRTILRKRLVVGDACAKEVFLAFVARERRGHNATLRILINGHEVLRPPSPIATPKARQYWELVPEGEWNWSRWYYVPIPIEYICPGENIIDINSKNGVSGWQIMVGDYANFEKGALPGEIPAHSSAKSEDGCRTWDTGVGEYVIRLIMNRYRKAGWIVSEVFDAAGQQDNSLKVPIHVESVMVKVDAEAPEKTGIDLSLRWSDMPYSQDEEWTDWEPVNLSGEPVKAKGRYLQWRLVLYTKDPLVSPALKSVTILSDHEAPPSIGWLRIIAIDNPKILRSSYEFSFGRYDHSKLQRLRRLCGLDSLVSDAKDDWEIAKRLMRLAYLIPIPRPRICPWDVLEWIEIKRDERGKIVLNKYDGRRRDKMCLYPNIVLTELLMAMGIPARHVNINSEGMSGHEVCEAWSNVHRKWIQLDATRDFYWVNKITGEPLSTLEVHRDLIRGFDKVEKWEDPYVFRIDDRVLEGKEAEAYESGEWPYPLSVNSLYKTHAHFRIIPRNDFCEHPYPLPISQGSEVWCWDGYLNWADDMVPPLQHFSNHTNRPADMYWTQNQTHMTIICLTPGIIRVLLETDMPNFARFEGSIDGNEWKPLHRDFEYRLKPGVNEILVRAVNSVEMPGIVSKVILQYDPSQVDDGGDG